MVKGLSSPDANQASETVFKQTQYRKECQLFSLAKYDGIGSSRAFQR